MNRSIFWRLLWKEYRLQRALWISMVLLTTLIQVLVWLLVEPKDRFIGLFMTAVALPASYALGCGASLFAGEREAGTYQFQRALPVGGGRVLAGKATLAAVSIAAMLGMMWLLAQSLCGGWVLSSRGQTMLWGVVGFFGVEMFVWSMLFSLLLGRVLPAAIFGVAAASIGVQVAAGIAAQIDASTVVPAITLETYAAAIPWRAGIAALAAMADVWLALRWFRERRDRRLRFTGTEAAADVPGEMAAFAARFRMAGRATMLGRLVWQHWRQSVLTLTALCAPLVALAAIAAYNGEDFRNSPEMLVLLAILTVIDVPLVGVCAFAEDQHRSSYRFLAHHGARPRYVWLSRLLLPAMCSLLLALCISLCVTPVVRDVADTRVFAYTLGYVVLAVTAGQCCGLAFSSSILAGLFGVLMAIVVGAWYALMWFWQINWLWSVLPVPAALLLASWLRTPDWLVERKKLWAWVGPGLALAVPAVALVVAVPLYRIYQIPAVDPGFSPEQYARPMTAEERATLDLYAQALEELSPIPNVPETAPSAKKELTAPALLPGRVAWVDANPEAIALAIRASRGRLFVIDDTTRPGPYAISMFLPDLLIYSAATREERGELDEAIDQYLAAIRISVQLRHTWLLPSWSDDVEKHVYARLPFWAARRGQTPKRALRALHALDQLTCCLSAGDDRVKSEHIYTERFLSKSIISGGAESIVSGSSAGIPRETIVWLYLPWERARALRLLNLITRARLDAVARADSQGQAGAALSVPNLTSSADEADLPYRLLSPKVLDVPPVRYDAQYGEVLVRDCMKIEALRRAMKLVLAIKAWKLEHGSLPRTLEDLVGRYLERLPLDPYSGSSFAYFREGVPIALHPHSARRASTIPAGTPLILPKRDGETLRHALAKKGIGGKTGPGSSEAATEGPSGGGTWHTIDTIDEIWQPGWPLPIP